MTTPLATRIVQAIASGKPKSQNELTDLVKTAIEQDNGRLVSNSYWWTLHTRIGAALGRFKEIPNPYGILISYKSLNSNYVMVAYNEDGDAYLENLSITLNLANFYPGMIKMLREEITQARRSANLWFAMARNATNPHIKQECEKVERTHKVQVDNLEQRLHNIVVGNR
jgi:hypothetical protein